MDYVWSILYMVLRFTQDWRVQSPASCYQLSKPQKCCTPSSLHAASSFVLAHTLAKVRNFERVVSKTQRVHATAFSRLHERC